MKLSNNQFYATFLLGIQATSVLSHPLNVNGTPGRQNSLKLRNNSESAKIIEISATKISTPENPVHTKAAPRQEKRNGNTRGFLSLLQQLEAQRSGTGDDGQGEGLSNSQPRTDGGEPNSDTLDATNTAADSEDDQDELPERPTGIDLDDYPIDDDSEDVQNSESLDLDFSEIDSIQVSHDTVPVWENDDLSNYPLDDDSEEDSDSLTLAADFVSTSSIRVPDNTESIEGESEPNNTFPDFEDDGFDEYPLDDDSDDSDDTVDTVNHSAGTPTRNPGTVGAPPSASGPQLNANINIQDLVDEIALMY
ncbi:hypothetical protein AX774_g436 [Zancudomyces culisetae]|uniref:Uncharacterized protein n=1 Tax=Zancudomyces culisetae TaxID=1213189 RepID=A0A1R1PYI8_ZANCU|nr:hypothetical protein AX774_g436 [Zancudomyces culisetae]|eukprot:OMH86017.1 hypothetical protein AX774_g436 [Zancudomyces culisetae]